MSDRTSAGIYGDFFRLLARDPTEQHKELALKLWKGSAEHDFSPCQMEADAALRKLGLAINRVEHGERSVVYRKHSGQGFE